jgi:hypothetical protein
MVKGRQLRVACPLRVLKSGFFTHEVRFSCCLVGKCLPIEQGVMGWFDPHPEQLVFFGFPGCHCFH